MALKSKDEIAYERYGRFYDELSPAEQSVVNGLYEGQDTSGSRIQDAEGNVLVSTNVTQGITVWVRPNGTTFTRPIEGVEKAAAAPKRTAADQRKSAEEALEQLKTQGFTIMSGVLPYNFYARGPDGRVYSFTYVDDPFPSFARSLAPAALQPRPTSMADVLAGAKPTAFRPLTEAPAAAGGIPTSIGQIPVDETAQRLGAPYLGEGIRTPSGALLDFLPLTTGGILPGGSLTATGMGPSGPSFEGRMFDPATGEPVNVGFGFSSAGILEAAGFKSSGDPIVDAQAALTVQNARQIMAQSLESLLGRAPTPAQVQDALAAGTGLTARRRQAVSAQTAAEAALGPEEIGAPSFQFGGQMTVNEPVAMVGVESGQVQAMAGEAGPETITFEPNFQSQPLRPGEAWYTAAPGQPRPWMRPQPPPPPLEPSMNPPGGYVLVASGLARATKGQQPRVIRWVVTRIDPRTGEKQGQWQGVEGFAEGGTMAVLPDMKFLMAHGKMPSGDAAADMGMATKMRQRKAELDAMGMAPFVSSEIIRNEFK